MLMEAIKRCERCGADKPISNFYSSPARSDGMRSCCKACNAEKCRLQRAANKLRPRDRAGSTKKCCRCERVFPVSEFHKDAGSTDGLYRFCRGCGVVHARACRYGLTRERVVEMLQQSCCEACGSAFESDREKHIDHRHADGAVRGVLCDRCNKTLGQCEENPAILMGLCEYLARTASVDYRKQPYPDTKMGKVDICSLANTPPRLSEPNVRRADSGH